MRVYPPIEERFSTSYERVPGFSCWFWVGATSSNGYGHIMHNKRVYSAHRMSYLLNKGEMPIGLHVLHKCDVKVCVNPEHLFLGTAKDNMQDKKSKNRGYDARGSRNNAAKLTDEQVKAVRSDSDSTGVALARKYGVSIATISRIRNYKAWEGVK